MFADVAAFTMTMAGQAQGDTTKRVFAAIVSASYFSTLDVPLVAGRNFTTDEERPGSNVPVAVVGHSYVRKAGISPEAAIGQTVRINARDYTIVGVVPEGFTGTMALVWPEFWLPLGVYERVTDDIFNERREALADANHRPLMLVARLREGLAVSSAAPALTALSTRLERADPAGNRNQALHVQRLSLGLLLSWGVGKALSGLLYEVSAADPLVFAIAPVVLSVAALVAAYVPARRATRILPLSALRSE